MQKAIRERPYGFGQCRTGGAELRSSRDTKFNGDRKAIATTSARGKRFLFYLGQMKEDVQKCLARTSELLGITELPSSAKLSEIT
jgi:hypothetical protein